MKPHLQALSPAEVAEMLNTPLNSADPALVADVRRFFVSMGPDTHRERRIQAWRDDATPSTRSAVIELLDFHWQTGLARSIAKSLISRIAKP